MSPQRPPFRADLEGLRGIAILLVVLFHASVPGLAGGFVGVDVFFVLSGFFITGLLIAETQETGGVNLTDFYAKRSLRLLPPLLVVLLTTLALVMWQYAPIDRASIAANARAVAFGSGNMAFASGSVDYFSAGENPLLHTWSLAVEQQFYFVWPLLFVLVSIAFARRVSPTAYATPSTPVFSEKPLLAAFIAVAALSFGASVLVTRSAQSWAFFSMPTRVWEFALGGIVAAVFSRGHALSMSFKGREISISLVGQVMQVIALGAITVAVLTYNSGTPYPGVAALLPAVAAVFLLVGGSLARETFINEVLSFAPFRWIGGLSYGWYLWHWPLVGLAGVLHPSIGAWGKLAWCAAALVLAWLTHRFIEQPSRTGKLATFSSGKIAVASFAATIVAALIAQGAVVAANRTVSQSAQKQFAAARGSRVDHGCWGTTVEEIKEPCEFGDTKSSTTVVLFGDSHAEHWFGALDRIGKERGWKVVLMVKGGCPVSDLPGLKHVRLKSYYHECTRFREAMMQRILALRPTVAILSSWEHYISTGDDESWKVSTDMWKNGLRRTYSRLSAAGIPVVAIRGTPRTPFNVPGCLSRKEAGLMFAQACEYDLASAFIPQAAAAQTEAARGLNVRFVDMNDQVCSTTPCGVMKNGVVVFTDNNHLTVDFSRSVAGTFGARVATAASALGAHLP